MNWNYRVCTKLDPTGDRYFTIRRIYYEDGIAHSYGEPMQVYAADTCNELRSDFDLQLQAFGKPVIDLDHFPNEYEGPLNDEANN